jgi:hypothetical protein
MFKRLKRAGLIALGCTAAVVIILLGLFAWESIITPTLVLRSFDAFASRHIPGSPISELFDDPFLARAVEIRLSSSSGDVIVSAWTRRLDVSTVRTAAAVRRSGKLTLEWVYMSPFGRAFLDISFVDGRITGSKKSCLD